MPAACCQVSCSPAAIVPSRTPVTGLSRPIVPTVPAGSFARPANQHSEARAVAISDT